MNAASKIQPSKANPDLQLAFDVGHSSIGWAVLQTVGGTSSTSPTSDINILGCGVVTFPADDCLAIDRRNKRRQRRNIRSRRQRVERMEKLLAQWGVTLRNRWKEIELLQPPFTSIAVCPATSQHGLVATGGCA